MSPNLHILAGPNGAGKTTFANEFLPDYMACLNFVNADLIAKGLSPFNPQSAAIKAGRLMLEQTYYFADQKLDFGIETTLSGKSNIRVFNDLKAKGYRLHLYFLWISDIDIALLRIADRVRRGGHHVKEEDVRRRFSRGISNFFNVYRQMMDFWVLLNNSTEYPTMIAYNEFGKIEIKNARLYNKLQEQYLRL